MSDTNTKETKDYAALVADMKAEKLKAAERIAAIKKEAKAAGQELPSDKQRLTADEIVRTYAKSTVTKYVTAVLTDNTDAIAEVDAKIARLTELLSSDPENEGLQIGMEGLKGKRLLLGTTASVSVDADKHASMRKLLVALVKSEKLTPVQIARVLKDVCAEGVNILPAVGFKKVAGKK